jgi:dipeptidyl aminopeptidase/acylaminoacyl peptidase
MHFLTFFLVLLMSEHAIEPDKRPITVDDLLAVRGVSDPQVSPDGKHIVYVVSEIDRDANKSNTSLWLVPVAGGDSRRLTTTPGANNHPRWSPDGKTIAFVSDRGGSTQVWLLPLDGGEPRQLTKLPVDVSGPIWSPRGDKLAFVAEVYPGKSPQETADSDKKKGENRSKARTYDQLMIRHWNVWDDGKRSHLFVCDAVTGESKDLIPDWKVNVPPAPFGGSSDYAWSGDGSALAFTSEPLEDHAVSTNSDIWHASVDGTGIRNLTAANKGADAQPAFSADGKWLAWVSQARAGFEADQWVLNYASVSETGEAAPIPVSKGSDRSVQSFSWDPNGPNLIAVLDDGGFETVTSFPTIARRAPLRLFEAGTFTSAAVTRNGQFVLLRNAANKPAEIYRGTSDANVEPLTHHNDALLEKLDLAPAERFTFSGSGGDEVQGWLVKPPAFDANKKYPVVFLIHGGPQGAWHDEWHNRWNYELFAAPGYCVVAINPRGSTGFGQKFTDEISRDWNGKVYEDLMTGLDHALKTYQFLDGNRVAAAGGSYGGYMVNWIAGHTDRFKALISHAGIFDLTSMNVTTEELWFSTWEFGGMPWETPDLHSAQSPSTFVKNFKTPTLVIHGALDFRVPDMQGLAMFTALQKQGVASRYLFFPDEGHWITKAANRVVWWNEVHAWLAKYLK